MLWRELGRKRNQGREEKEVLDGVEGRPLGEATCELTPVEDERMFWAGRGSRRRKRQMQWASRIGELGL